MPTTPACLAAAASSRPAEAESERGFSTSTCLPARTKSSASGTCHLVPVAMMTAWRSLSSTSFLWSVSARTWSCSAAPLARSASTSQTATRLSVSERCAPCPWAATPRLPAPMSAVVTFLTAMQGEDTKEDMASERARSETRYAERSDDVEAKLALLRTARERGDYRLAEALADSLKDGLTAERLLEGSRLSTTAGPKLDAAGWRPVTELPAAWAGWAAGWSHFQVVTLEETSALAREAEPVDVGLAAPVEWCASLAREVRVAMA